MTLADAERWLDGLINRERQVRVDYARFGLEAIQTLLARIGSPERGLSVVHVAGSKGKGSTALLVEALLLALGESVGTFTSPHLARWTERFRLDGQEVAGQSLADVVARIRPHVDAMRREDERLWPSFFDATTAAAFALFEGADVDRAVLEVGLGGRLDSTNAAISAVTLVTSIEYEHTDRLGDTLAAIAGEKAGILKPGAPCVMGHLPPEAAKVVEERAAVLGVRLERLGEEFDVEPLGGPRPGSAQSLLRFRFADGFAFDARLSVPGPHQHSNAALAVAAVRALGVHDDTRLAEAAQRAFAKVLLPGRIEVIERDPWVIVDAAHTRESVRALMTWLEGVPGTPRHFVLSLSQDKPLDAILDLMLARADVLTLTRAEPIRSRDPGEVAARVAARGDRVTLRVVDDPSEAVRSARAVVPAGGLLCVVGSVYLAGVARAVLVAS
jgi:dihydrofolate synthase/folylpolyglutamate synthase